MNTVLNLTENLSEADLPAVVTHSSGNHAQALALAAKIKGLKAHIVMPNNAPAVKKAAVKDYGANIIECGVSQQVSTNKAIKKLRLGNLKTRKI
jgi:threonine dehydratase